MKPLGPLGSMNKASCLDVPKTSRWATAPAQELQASACLECAAPGELAAAS